MQAAWLSTQIRKAWGRKFPGLGRDQPGRYNRVRGRGATRG